MKINPLKERIIKILEPYFLQWQFQEHPDNLGRKMTEIATQILELFAQEEESTGNKKGASIKI